MSEVTLSHKIVGVHGLRRKPPLEILREGWIGALQEGLRRNHGLDIDVDHLGFELVYWADWLGVAPYGPGEDPEPYIEAEGTGSLPVYRNRWRDHVLTEALDVASAPVDWADSQRSLDALKRYIGLDELAMQFLKVRVADLAEYYGDPDRRAQLRQKLRDALRSNRGKRIMLIAHSMGSIVAYDVLRDLGKQIPEFEVSHFVTIGSPLGMPYVLHKIREENASIRTPSVVQRWTNLADRRDPVAVDVHLADEFEPNDRGVSVDDKLVINAYRNSEGKSNHHKIFGYLRTPEAAELVRAFV